MEGLVLGQFIPGNSVIHKLDPRTKLVWSLALVWVVFAVDGLREFVGCGILIGLLYVMAGVAGSMARALRPGLYLVLFTLLMNMFFYPGQVILNLGFLTISREGIFQGLTIGMRLLFLISVSSLVTLTTSPLRMTEGLETMLHPLRKFGVPVSELAMMTNIALKFIPTFLEETDKIIKAQTARGADFNSWHLGRRFKYLTALLVPLFVSAFRKADELSVAIESRGYVVGMDRTSLHELKLGRADYLALIIGIGAVGVFLGYKYIA